MTPKLSIVAPIYNEQATIEELVRRISKIAEQAGYVCPSGEASSSNVEVLLIDDGSTDSSWRIIERLSSEHSFVRGVRFRRNFGKSAALAAGFERARGDCVVTIDADLQDEPSEIPNLLKELDGGYDVVSGWKKDRQDPWHKTYPSLVFNWLLGKLTGVQLHDHNCGLKAYRREVLSEIQLYGEMHRFIPVLAAARGFRVSEVPVQHHERRHGESKFGVERLIKGFLDLLTVFFLTGYGNRPQHFLGSIGLASFLSGALGLLFMSFWWVFTRITPLENLHLHQKAMFYFCILGVLLGVQLVSFGFIAELITSLIRPARPVYSVIKETEEITTPEEMETQSR